VVSRSGTAGTALEHEGRRLVFEAIVSNPGINVLSLSHLLAMGRSNVRYHVAILRRWNMIRGLPSSGEVRLYAAGAKPPEGRPIGTLPARIEVVRALESARDGLTREELHAAIAKVPRRTRNYTIHRLLELGEIHEAIKDGALVLRLGRPDPVSV
jgi:predicted transcriptional regulator